MRRAIIMSLIFAMTMAFGCSKPKDEAQIAQDEAQAALDALNKLKAEAEADNADAQYKLAGMYMSGDGVEQNDEVAMQWTAKAAVNGNVDARFEIATVSLVGESEFGIKPELAKQWFEEAAAVYYKDASAGDLKAQERLAWMYETGNGVPQSDERAEIWQVEATKQKVAQHLPVEPIALYNLGVAYYQGDVIEKDEGKAAEIFKATAAAGLDQAQYSLGIFYTSGTAVEEDQEKAFELFVKAAEQGHDKAQFEVAQRYYYGYGTNVSDHAKAFELFKKSAEQGNTKSQLMLGMMYGKGEAPEGKDYGKAAFWLEKAKDDNEFPIGKAFLGMMYLQGQGVEQDQVKGLRLLKEAAALGDPTAIQALKTLKQIE